VVLNLSWFVASFQRLSTLVAPCSSIGFCNITAELFSKRPLLRDLQAGPRVPVEKPCPRVSEKFLEHDTTFILQENEIIPYNFSGTETNFAI